MSDRVPSDGGGKARDDGSDFDFAPPPPEWTEEYRRTNLTLVATATLSEPREPTQQQREHTAMAATILHFGARIEALTGIRPTVGPVTPRSSGTTNAGTALKSPGSSGPGQNVTRPRSRHTRLSKLRCRLAS